MDNNAFVGMPKNQDHEKELIKAQIQNTVSSRNLYDQRILIQNITTELNLTMTDCAAALLYLIKDKAKEIGRVGTGAEKAGIPPLPFNQQPSIRLVRYRLDLGAQHNINIDELKKVLVEESGVDINNIANVRIQDLYTLIDLPDEMPQEIFHHLKTVEINERMLDIRRVKPRNKKRINRRHRNARKSHATPQEVLNSE